MQRGEAFGIIGANGAGKSTILKLLTGIMRPTEGSIRVAGRVSALIEVERGLSPGPYRARKHLSERSDSRHDEG